MNTLIKTASLLFIVAYLAACNAGSSDQDHLKKAEGFIATNQTKAAIIELKNALKKNKDNARARFLLGQLSLRQGDPASAEKELRIARKLGTPAESVLPLLADALLKQGKTDELIELDPTGLPSEARARVMATQGTAKLLRGDKADAEKLIMQAVEDYPAAREVQAAQARMLAADGKIEQAIQTITTTLDKDPEYADGWMILGTLEQSRRNHQGAVKAFSRALEINRNDLVSRLARAMSLTQRKELEKAQKDLDKLKRVAPQHGGVNYVQGLVYLSEKKLDDALSAFEQAVASNTSNPAVFYFLSAIHLAKGNLEQADTYAEQFLTKMPGSIEGRKLAARIKMQRNQPAAAESLLLPVVANAKDDEEAMNLLATVLLRQGKTDEALGLLNRIAALKPESAKAQLRMGAGLLLEGEEEKAAIYLKNAAKLDPNNPQAETLLILSLIRQKKFDEALAAAEKYRQKNADSAAPYNLIARIHLFKGDREKAMAALKQAAEIEPGNPQALLLLAQFAIQEKDHAQARKYLEEILQHHREHLGALMQLAALELRENRVEQTISHLEKAIAAHPKALEPRLTLARLYLAQNKPQQAALQLSELNEKQKQNPEALRVIGLIQLANNSFAQARETLENLVATAPEAAEAHFLLARAYAGLNQKDRMERELQKAIELDPNHFNARISYSRLLLQEKKFDAVKEQLKALTKNYAEHPEVLKLQAGLAVAEEKPEQAIAIYEKLMESRPSTANMQILAMLKWRSGDPEGAIALQKSWTEKHPEDKLALLALADSYLKKSLIQEAVATYEKVLKLEPKNVVALNNLAWYLKESDPARALEYAEAAYALAPQEPSILDTYAMVLLANGQKDKALRQIERAVDIAPPSATMVFHHARILAANGENDTAANVLELLLSKGKDFPEKAEAEKMLKELRGN